MIGAMATAGDDRAREVGADWTLLHATLGTLDELGAIRDFSDAAAIAREVPDLLDYLQTSLGRPIDDQTLTAAARGAWEAYRKHSEAWARENVERLRAELIEAEGRLTAWGNDRRGEPA